MFLAAEQVSNVPQFRAGLAWHSGASLHVLCLRRRASIAADRCTDQATGDYATHRGKVTASSIANLVSQDPANDGANDAGRHI